MWFEILCVWVCHLSIIIWIFFGGIIYILIYRIFETLYNGPWDKSAIICLWILWKIRECMNVFVSKLIWNRSWFDFFFFFNNATSISLRLCTDNWLTLYQIQTNLNLSIPIDVNHSQWIRRMIILQLLNNYTFICITHEANKSIYPSEMFCVYFYSRSFEFSIKTSTGKWFGRKVCIYCRITEIETITMNQRKMMQSKWHFQSEHLII